MGEQVRSSLATIAAETMYNLWELTYRHGGLDLDKLMCRLKDLAAYSLTHAEVLEQREGVELLALAMFFGATSDPSFHHNQQRLARLNEETLAYQGRAGPVEQEVTLREKYSPQVPGEERGRAVQPRLL